MATTPRLRLTRVDLEQASISDGGLGEWPDARTLPGANRLMISVVCDEPDAEVVAELTRLVGSYFVPEGTAPKAG